MSLHDFNIYNDKDLFIIESITNSAIHFMDNLNNDIQWQELTCTSDETIHITNNKNTIDSFINHLNINNVNYTNFIN